MNKEFIPYELALELKQLGFNEECFGVYVAGKLLITNDSVYNSKDIPVIKVPTFSQCFRWFRETHQLPSWVYTNDNEEYWYSIRNGRTIVRRYDPYISYDEAEIACLIKLIELVKNKQ